MRCCVCGDRGSGLSKGSDAEDCGRAAFCRLRWELRGEKAIGWGCVLMRRARGRGPV